jgi:periplasmic divalent cation tolerance protein
MKTDNMHLVYITTASKSEAVKISQSLISQKLVACCNIIQDSTSIYEWEGQIKEVSESIIIAKTSQELVPQVIIHTKSIHSYKCPCIFSIKIEESDKDFTKWVESYLKLPY